MDKETALAKARGLCSPGAPQHDPCALCKRIAAELMRAYGAGAESIIFTLDKRTDDHDHQLGRIRAEADALEWGEG